MTEEDKLYADKIRNKAFIHLRLILMWIMS